MLRVLHLLKRFQYSYGPNSTILCSLAEYKESDNTACLAVASLKARDTSGWLLLASPACLQVSRKSSLYTAGIKTTILVQARLQVSLKPARPADG